MAAYFFLKEYLFRRFCLRRLFRCLHRHRLLAALHTHHRTAHLLLTAKAVASCQITYNST